MSQFSVPWTPREVRYGLFGRLVSAVAKLLYAIFAPIVKRVPWLILIAGVLAGGLTVWATALVFHYVDVHVLEAAAAAEVESTTFLGFNPTQIGELLTEAEAPVVGLLKYALWPVQFRFVRDVIILVAIFIFFCLEPSYMIWWERKVAGRIQSRLGLMRVGCWHGWAQSPADGVKVTLKEDLIPDGADKPLFRLAPYFNIIPSLMAFAALPFGLAYVFRELDVALLFILAMLGVEVMGVVMAGWGSNNKWSLYGGMREACQMISYEIPMGMALLVPVLCVGSLSLTEIGEAQSGGWFTWLAFSNPFAFGAFVAYFIA